LRRGITHESHYSFALTEKDFGSDATSLECSATKVEGGYKINGNKRWIGIATHSDAIITFAREKESKEIMGFIVNTKSSPGLRVTKIEGKYALQSV